MSTDQPNSLPKEIVHDKLTQQDNTILAVIANHSSISFNSLYDEVKITINEELLKKHLEVLEKSGFIQKRIQQNEFFWSITSKLVSSVKF